MHLITDVCIANIADYTQTCIKDIKHTKDAVFWKWTERSLNFKEANIHNCLIVQTPTSGSKLTVKLQTTDERDETIWLPVDWLLAQNARSPLFRLVVCVYACLLIWKVFNPFTATDCRISGLNVHTYTPANSIYDCSVTSLLSILHILMEIFSRAHAKGLEKASITSNLALLLVVFRLTRRERQAREWKG